MSKFETQHSTVEVTSVGVAALNLICKTDSKHWYVSYNPSRAEYGDVTTALVLGQVEYCLVLNGDHRKEFERIIEDNPGFPRSRLDMCLEYIREHKEELNEYSDKII